MGIYLTFTNSTLCSHSKHMFSVSLKVFVSWVTLYRCVFLNKVLIIRPKNIMGLRVNNTTRVFRFNVIGSQYMRICFNMRTALCITLANTAREVFSLTDIFIFYTFITFYLAFCVIYFTFPCTLYLIKL